MSDFKHFPLELIKPDFDSSLTSLVIKLNYLRKHRLGGSTPPPMFFQLKRVFHLLESLASARIEGNRTTIEELVEEKLTPSKEPTEAITEIANMEKALTFIDEAVKTGDKISRGLILEIHKLTVQSLSKEGDRTPGTYRTAPVKIIGSNHTPPDFTQVEPYMEELINFLNTDHDQKYDLIKIALAHHRFAWIHPFHNGNGRVVRLITYALLIGRGFNVGQGRILNPSAVFCMDRDQYYENLSSADSGEEKNLIQWCEYVLNGIASELSKIDALLNYDNLSKRILDPAISFLHEREQVTKLEAAILRIARQKKIFQASDIEPVTSDLSPQERSRVIRRMKTRNLIEPTGKNSRSYVLNMSYGPLLRGIIQALSDEGFVASAVRGPAV